MAKTLLNGVNEVLKKAKLIQGDSGALTTLSDSARQVWIDTAVQAWNETILDLFTAIEEPMPTHTGEGTLTLVADQREYTFTGDLIYWPLVDETNGLFIHEYPGGFSAMVRQQPQPGSYTGIPNAAVIEPVSGKLRLDRVPKSGEAGRVYKYRYAADGELTAAGDAMPFSDSVFISIVPAVTEKFTFYDRREFTPEVAAMSMGAAGRQLRKSPARTHYGRSRMAAVGGSVLTPFAD